ncbi:MAG: phosphoribosyltransferase [Acidimicrobiia bacterium]
MRFRNRNHAGELLASMLADRYRGIDDPLVLGLPRGGVPVAAPVARILEGQLDVFVVRKLGVPGHQELAMGAIASGGVRVLNDRILTELGIDDADVEGATKSERVELDRRERLYRGDRPAIELTDRAVIIVDDGIATGASMRAAVDAVAAGRPGSLTIAVPVAPEATARSLGAIVDDVVVVSTPDPFGAVGSWYDDFGQTSDEQVTSILAEQP